MDYKATDIMLDQASLYYIPASANVDLTNIDTVLVNLDKYMLGLGNNGVKFKETKKIKDIGIAGANERQIKGFQRVISCSGEVEGDVLIVNKSLLEMSLYQSTTSTSTKYDKYVSKTGLIDASAYGTLFVIANKGTDKVIIVLKNCYNANGFSMDFKDGDEANINVKFTACVASPSDSSAPVEVYIPKVVATT